MHTNLNISHCGTYILNEKVVAIIDGMNFFFDLRSILLKNCDDDNDSSDSDDFDDSEKLCKKFHEFSRDNLEYELKKCFHAYRNICMKKFMNSSRICFVYKPFGSVSEWGLFMKLFKEIVIDGDKLRNHELICANRCDTRFLDNERDDRIVIKLAYHFINLNNGVKVLAITNDRFRSMETHFHRSSNVTVINRICSYKTFDLEKIDISKQDLNSFIRQIRCPFRFSFKNNMILLNL